jgi:hypothetical protein
MLGVPNGTGDQATAVAQGFEHLDFGPLIEAHQEVAPYCLAAAMEVPQQADASG